MESARITLGKRTYFTTLKKNYQGGIRLGLYQKRAAFEGLEKAADINFSSTPSDSRLQINLYGGGRNGRKNE